MNPIGFAPSIPANFPSPAPTSQGAIVAQPFAIQYQRAQVSAGHDDSAIADRKPPPQRKAVASPKQSADPTNAKPEDRVALVQAVLAQQPQDRPVGQILSFSMSRGLTSLESLIANLNLIDGAAPIFTPQDVGQEGSQSVSQLAPAPPPIAFSLNLQKSEPADQKSTGPASSISSTGQQQNPLISLGASGGENAPPDTGSNQSGAGAEKQADPKLALPSVSKQDGSSVEIPSVAGTAPAPVQAFANAATHSTTAEAPRQSSHAPVTDAPAVQQPEPSVTPTPASSRQFDLTVPNDAGHPVGIRISQRGDDVQVTVRTPDGILAQSLRHNLPELSENLSRTGLREEVLHTAQSHSSGDADSGDRSRGDTQQREGGQQSHHSPQERGRPRAKEQSNNQQTKSFAELIRTKERII